VIRKRLAKGLIHHSDRGNQYCSYNYIGLPEEFEIKASISKKGNYYDNAAMESFWETLK
jgi:putative transposase